MSTAFGHQVAGSWEGPGLCRCRSLQRPGRRRQRRARGPGRRIAPKRAYRSSRHSDGGVARDATRRWRLWVRCRPCPRPRRRTARRCRPRWSTRPPSCKAVWGAQDRARSGKELLGTRKNWSARSQGSRSLRSRTSTYRYTPRLDPHRASRLLRRPHRPDTPRPRRARQRAPGRTQAESRTGLRRPRRCRRSTSVLCTWVGLPSAEGKHPRRCTRRQPDRRTWRQHRTRRRRGRRGRRWFPPRRRPPSPQRRTCRSDC